MKSKSLGLVLVVVLAACSKFEQKPLTTAAGIEPTEKVLTILAHRQYEELAKLGGLAVGVPQSNGQVAAVKLNPKLHNVKKDKCVPDPFGKQRSYECTLTITITLRDGDAPGSQGERIAVHQDDKGEWSLGS